MFQGKLHPISKIIPNQVALATMGTALFVGPNALQGAFCSFGVLARKSTRVVIFIEGRLRLEELPLNVISFDFISFNSIYIYIHILYISIYISFISFHLISFHLPKPIFHFAWIIMKCLHNKKNIYGVSVLISSSSLPCGPGDILELGSAALFAVQMWRCEKLIRQVPESQA